MILPMATALIGSFFLGLYDIKTNEIPDFIPSIMALIGLFYHLHLSIISKGIQPLANSIIVGVVFFIFGYAMYIYKIWGGGDVKVLSSIGFLIPQFFMEYFLNVLFVGIIYAIIVNIIMKLMGRKPKIKTLVKDLKVGDVLVGSTIIGITEDQIKKLHQDKIEYVFILNEAPFIPVLFLALIPTFLNISLLSVII